MNDVRGFSTITLMRLAAPKRERNKKKGKKFFFIPFAHVHGWESHAWTKLNEVNLFHHHTQYIRLIFTYNPFESMHNNHNKGYTFHFTLSWEMVVFFCAANNIMTLYSLVSLSLYITVLKNTRGRTEEDKVIKSENKWMRGRGNVIFIILHLSFIHLLIAACSKIWYTMVHKDYSRKISSTFFSFFSFFFFWCKRNSVMKWRYLLQ